MADEAELRALRRSQDELTVVCDTIRDLTSTLSVRDVLQRLLDRTLRHLEAELASILLVGDDRTLTIAVARGLPRYVIDQTVVRWGEGISGYVAATGKGLLVSDVEQDPRFQRRNRERYYTRSLLSAPIMLQNTLRGVINVNNKISRQGFDDADLHLLQAIADHAAAALRNAERYEEMVARARADTLTGLANHGYFWSAVDLEIKRADRYARELALVMVDVDEFKQFNDRFGHIEGDTALRRISELIRERCRSSDVAARYGGEEFAVVLPETSLEGARIFGEKIRQSVEAEPFGPDRDQRLTVSVGATSFPEVGETARDLVDAADRRLYRAKSMGRNQVCATDA